MEYPKAPAVGATYEKASPSSCTSVLVLFAAIVNTSQNLPTSLAQAGWTTEEMLVGYNDIVNMSIATQLDLATCTDIVSSSLTAFGLGAKDVARSN